MANFFKKLFGGTNASVLGIDIGSAAIKIVQLRKKSGQAVLETYGSLALGPYGNVEIGRSPNLPPEKIIEALIDVLRESHVSTNQAGLAVPYGASLISVAELPEVAEAELMKIIPFEARKYIPVPLSEVMLDWMIIPKAVGAADKTRQLQQPQPQSQAQAGVEPAQAPPSQVQKTIEVLLVAMHNETISRYQSIVTQAGLNVSFLEIEAFSNIRSVLDQGATSEMLIDIGSATTKVYIVEKGIIRTPHLVNHGSQDVTMALSSKLGISVEEAEVLKRGLVKVPEGQQKDVGEVILQALEPLFSEINQVLLSYQKRYNKDIAKTSIVGGGARLANLLTFAESRIRTNVVLGNPFGKTLAPAFLEQVLKETGPEFAGAVGVALRKLQEQG
ncbi:pilus assembly protein PilM [Candidatus Parcubacteria bacterium]|nr:pilus assembly protein PilM [Candidatus Parcubacteria bacterium]